MTYLDTGIRCDRHVGEAFPVRCGACETLSTEYRALGIRPPRPLEGDAK